MTITNDSEALSVVVCDNCGGDFEQTFCEYTGDSEEAQWTCLLCQSTVEDIAELQRFREREPLVQAALTTLWSCPNDDALDEMCKDCHRLVASVRDFGLCIAGAANPAASAAPTPADEHGADAESLNKTNS